LAVPMFPILPFLLGVAVGAAYCAPVGPVKLEMVRRGLSVGFLAGFLVALGAVIGDAFWAAVGILGSSLLTDSIPLRVGIGVLGVGILLFVAWNAYRTSRQDTDYHLTDPPQQRTGFPVGVALSMANPFAVVFWLAVTASGALASLGVDRSHHVARILFFVGLVVGAILYGLALCAIVAWARRFVTGKAMSKINFGAALTLVGLAAFMAVRVVMLARKM
jgi:threonine/homoserine/homoserine lactone efflux protein